MSLVFRRVKKISKRSKKSRSKTKKSNMDTCEPRNWLLAVDDEHFPSLNAVYKTDIFGTPIDFHVRRGWDICGAHKNKVLLNCITFMKEYSSKSFDELRWEDYQCNRKNSRYFQERSYLKCLSNKNNTKKCEFELIQPTTKYGPADNNPKCAPSKHNNKFSNGIASDITYSDSKCAAKSLDHSQIQKFTSQTIANFGLIDFERKFSYEHFPLSKTDSYSNLRRASISALPIISEEPSGTSKETKPRSILTNVGKFSQINVSEEKETKHHREAASIVIENTKSVSNSRQECIEILKNKLVKYFENAAPTASVPYDFVSQNQNFYMPCANISFVYQNARPSPTYIKMNKSIFDSPRSGCCNYNQTFNKLEQIFVKHSLNREFFGFHSSKEFDIYGDYSEIKYTTRNKFNTKYFFSKIDPYSVSIPKISKAKNFLLGRDIFEDVYNIEYV